LWCRLGQERGGKQQDCGEKVAHAVHLKRGSGIVWGYPDQ
jgi:hypothetical protein